jgi:hypothetical protein
VWVGAAQSGAAGPEQRRLEVQEDGGGGWQRCQRKQRKHGGQGSRLLDGQGRTCLQGASGRAVGRQQRNQRLPPAHIHTKIERKACAGHTYTHTRRLEGAETEAL